VKAYLLAGGRGERLRPLTLETPKCLVPINGTPLLGIWLDLLGREGVTEVLLNVSHHVEQVRAFLSARRAGPAVTLVVEGEPIGSARTVLEQRDFVSGAESFWICYADNLTDMALTPIAAMHARHDLVLTLGLFEAPNPRAAGIIELDPSGRVVSFEEKPEQPRGSLANAGIYLARQSVFNFIPTRSDVVDFGHHVLPQLVGRMAGHLIDGVFIDVGTRAAFERAQVVWRERHPQKALA
jgi:mannose-1-phosphate guanylyltransferase